MASNGMTRLAQSNITLGKKKPTAEFDEEINTLAGSKNLKKIPLKNPTKNNHSK